MGQLDQLLGYLERDGVSEIILGVGRPIAMRNAAGLTNLTARPVSADQLTTILRGSPIAALVPTEDTTEPAVDVQIGTRKVRVQVGRRGDEVLVRLSRIDAPPPPSFTQTQPMARVAEAKPAPSGPQRGLDFDPSSIDVDLDTHRPKSGAVAGRGEFQRASDVQQDGGFQRTGHAANHTAPTKPSPTVSVKTSPRLEPIRAPASAPAKAPPPKVSFDDLSLDDGIELGAPLGLDDGVELGQPRVPFDEPVLSHNAENWEEDIPSLSANFELMPDDAPLQPPARSAAHAMSAGRAPTQQAPTVGLQAAMVTHGTVPMERSAPQHSAPERSAPVVERSAPKIATSAIPKPTGQFVALVAAARERGASDLHISAARMTSIRTGTDLVPLDPNGKPLSAADAEALLLPLIDAGAREQFERLGYVDFALEAPGGGRLRANICRQQQGLKGTFRLALPAPLPLDQLGLPAELAKVVAHHQGLVVIAGPSGHGKTTTLAALVDLVNSTKPYHILTIEDPIELVHQRKQAVVSQREVGRNTVSFARGLKASLREDPDVIVIGELRDRESVEIALTAAETGHLVLATMSTPSAAKTIDRLVDMFPPEEHSQVRASVAGALRAIVAQRLVPRRGGKGVVPAIELVTGVLPLAVMIREDKLYQLPNLMQRGRAFGMIRFDESLVELVRSGRIDEETALSFAESKKDLAATLQGQQQPAKTQAMWKDPGRR